jgi:dTDP-glucose 4,6-dehydratase
MQLATKKILVTGADGFIGSHLTEELVRRGWDVRAFVLYNAFNSWGWLDSAPAAVKRSLDVFSGDIRDPYTVKSAMQGCDVVLHLAALIAIPYSYRSPESYVDTNIRGTLNVLQAARELGVAKVVHTSTSEVYGTARFVPITEDHPLQGQSPYSATKIAADQLALSFHSSFTTPVAVIRPFNTYGPRQSARAVLPTIITQIASGKRVLQLGSLHPTRDFNYVKDTVEGFIAVAQSDAAIGRVFNIGSI